jgi:hypothetical protein
MVQMVMNLTANIGGSGSAQAALQSRGIALAQKLIGFAILGSGYAVIFAHGLMHATR